MPAIKRLPKLQQSLMICLLLVTWLPVSAASIAHLPFSFSYERPLSIPPSPASTAVGLRFLFEDSSGVDDPSTEVFDGFLFDETDAGRRFLLTSADDSEFDAFVARSVNGIDDPLLVLATGNNGGGVGASNVESFVLKGRAVPGGVDLAGQSIAALLLHIDDLTIDPTAGPRDQNWAVSGRLVFQDTAVVPLPPAAILFVSALAVLLTRRSRPAG